MSDLKNKHLDNLWIKLVPYISRTGSTSEIVKIVELFRECDTAIEDEMDLYSNLKESLDILKKSNEALLSANINLAREKHKLEGSLNYTMIQQLEARVEELTESLKEAEVEAENLKKKLDFQQNDIVRLRKDRDRKDEAIAKLAEIRDKLQQEVDDLKTRLNSMCGVKYDKYVRSRDIGYEEGQTDLWDMLQNVNNSQRFLIATCFPNVSCMDDILSWDLEDFLDAHKSWQEKKEQERIKYMREYLERFCWGRPCRICPLHTDGFACGRGKWFFDMTYEELKKHYDMAKSHYDKAERCGQYPLKRKDD